MGNKGIAYFLKIRNVPLDLSIMFTEYLREEINKQLIIRDKSRLRKLMGSLDFDFIMSYWLRFVYNLKMEILEQQQLQSQED